MPYVQYLRQTDEIIAEVSRDLFERLGPDSGLFDDV